MLIIALLTAQRHTAGKVDIIHTFQGLVFSVMDLFVHQSLIFVRALRCILMLKNLSTVALAVFLGISEYKLLLHIVNLVLF